MAAGPLGRPLVARCPADKELRFILCNYNNFFVVNDGVLDRFLKGGVTTPNPRTAAWAARVQTPGRTAAMHSVLDAMPPVER